MSWNLPKAIFLFAFLSAAIILTASIEAATIGAFAQSNKRAGAPLVYTTPPKTSVGKLILGESNVQEIRGKVSFMPTVANNDDTLAGTLIFTINDEARKKIGRLSDKPLKSIPASIMKKGVVANFPRGASCPVINLEIGATELDVAGLKLSFNRIVVDVIETPGEVQQHICAWTRQINAKRQRRGIIASLNRLISVEQ